MLAYTLKRLLAGLVTVFFIATATFAAMHAVPGDPLTTGKARSAEIRANLEAKYGLDRPVLVQYGVFLRNMAKGDFGISFTQQNRSVNDIIREHFPVSAVLGVARALLRDGRAASCSARSPRGSAGGCADRTILFLVVLGISVPSFVFAALGQHGVLALNQRAGATVLPVAGWGTVRHMLLPGAGARARHARLPHAADALLAARDREPGLRPDREGEGAAALAHLPRRTSSGTGSCRSSRCSARRSPRITTGGFVVESVFAIPGLGRYFVQAVQQLDYTVIMGLTVFYGAFLVADGDRRRHRLRPRRSADPRGEGDGVSGSPAMPSRRAPEGGARRSAGGLRRRRAAAAAARARRSPTGRTRGSGCARTARRSSRSPSSARSSSSRVAGPLPVARGPGPARARARLGAAALGRTARRCSPSRRRLTRRSSPTRPRPRPRRTARRSRRLRRSRSSASRRSRRCGSAGRPCRARRDTSSIAPPRGPAATTSACRWARSRAGNVVSFEDAFNLEPTTYWYSVVATNGAESRPAGDGARSRSRPGSRSSTRRRSSRARSRATSSRARGGRSGPTTSAATCSPG